MPRDFARTITLLRKEKKLTQKEAAESLGISQALLSHYEKGIRECGLGFVVKAAEYYGVSCDYLLGRTAEREYDLNELSSEIAPPSKHNTANVINRRLLDNTAGIIYDSLANVGNRKLTRTVTSYLMLVYYKIFRMIYHGNPANPDGLFTVSKKLFKGYSAAAQEKIVTDIENLCDPECESYAQRLSEVTISPEQIASDYPEATGSLFNVIRHAENTINRIK